MKILLVSGLSNSNGRFGISLGGVLLVVMALLLGTCGAGAWYGYQYAREIFTAEQSVLVAEEAARRLHQQREELQDTRLRTAEHLDALALRLGELQSHIMRLDALGTRLARIGQFDEGEFNFDEAPPRGGAEEPATAASVEAEELVREMDGLALMIIDRERKLELLEAMLMHRQLQDRVLPSGTPVDSGWISSSYGYRKDPFTGKRAFHRGVDIAGQKGDEVHAVASGIVTVAGDKHGYGKMVEIRHGNGYVTRYGHNQALKAKVGDIVAKGDVIALLGSSGRSTGPHVHFEVAVDGKTVNPYEYLHSLN